MIGSIVLKPYISLESQERDLIIILCSINIFFSLYYLWNVLRLEKIFKLENKNIVKFGKKIGVVTLLYIPHAVLFASLFFRNLHNIEIIMVSLIFLMETMLIIVIFKEVYDLVFLEESQRDYVIEADRKKYLERKKRPLSEQEQ